jgi:muconolactone D-isomerase
MRSTAAGPEAQTARITRTPKPGRKAMEFLTNFIITVPEGTPGQTLDDTEALEAQRAHELADQGHLLRLWTPPPELGVSRTLGLWQARDGEEIHAIVESLPMFTWMTAEITPLTPHPSDPGTKS